MDNEKRKILVVDDSSTNSFLLESLFRDEGFEVFTAFSGKKAIEIVLKDSPNIILLDIMMPGMTGYDVLETLAKNDVTKKIPVIMVTAKSKAEEFDKVIKMGAVDYIQKPIDINLLIEKVKKLVA